MGITLRETMLPDRKRIDTANSFTVNSEACIKKDHSETCEERYEPS